MMGDRVQDPLVQDLIPKSLQMQTVHQEIWQTVRLVKVTRPLDLTIDIGPQIDHRDMELFSNFDTGMCVFLREIVGPVQWQVDGCKGCGPHLGVDRCGGDQDDLGIGRVVG